MKAILAGTLLVISSLTATNVRATDGGGDPSPEQPIGQDWERRADVASLPSTYVGDASEFVIDTVRGGVFEGTLSYDRTTRQYNYVDRTMGTGGVLPPSEVQEAVVGVRDAYEASKKPGKICKGLWSVACLLVPIFIEEIVDNGNQDPPQDVENRAIDTVAAMCISNKRVTIQSINQLANQCMAGGGDASVDYGDQCGMGATVDCDYSGGGEGPGGPGGPGA